MEHPRPDLSPSLEILKRRIIESIARKSAARVESAAGTERLFAAQNPDGGWSDIDYADTLKPGSNDWLPLLHLQRLESMALAARVSCLGGAGAAQVEAVLRGLDFWFAQKPVCTTNYWFMAMGRNLAMKAIVILMEEWLAPAQKSAALDELHFAVRDLDGDGVHEYHFPQIGTLATGQNTFWLADIHLHAALLKNSATEVAAATRAMGGVVALTTREGINPDFSFLQHGPQLYSGGYGATFAVDAARILALLHGLPFAFTPAETATLRGYFLEGLQWMIRRGAWDPLVTGRQIARKENVLLSPSMLRAVEDMIRGDPGFAAAYRTLLDHIAGRNDAALTGHKVFHRADYSVHRRAGFSFHTRLSSSRTFVAETGNRENTQNYYLSQGANTLLLDGDEYAGIFPCWRWDRIPGVTAPERRPAPATRPWKHPGTLPFVGGAGDGTCGVSVQDLDWDNLTAKKCWFCFDDDIVCLGTAIKFYPANLPVATTLNQTLKKSDVLVAYGDEAGTVAAPTPGLLLRGPKWIHHGNVGYVLPHAADVELRNETGVTGDWHSINPGQYPSGTLETRDIFSLVIPHGRAAQNKDYAYVLLPVKSPEFVRHYAANPQSRIVANTPAVQAVRNDMKQLAGIVFWLPGEVRLTPGLAVSTDKRCIVWVNESSGRDIKVTVSCYEGGPVAVGLSFGSAPQKIEHFDLPGGTEVGLSVTRSISRTHA